MNPLFILLELSLIDRVTVDLPATATFSAIKLWTVSLARVSCVKRYGSLVSIN